MEDLGLAILLARVQFAFTVAFHIIFPAFTIGLASYLVVLEAIWLARKDDAYLRLYQYWSKIFALSFGMGVVSGLVMSYQFGTNWGPFAEKSGSVLGPLLGYEVLSAFFLEAGFLGIMLFGRERVGPALHFFATLMVGIGTLISAFWILSANSWMHTPAGFTTQDGVWIPENWLEVIFNPSFPYRFTHMTLAAYLTTAFVVGAVGAWHLLKDSANRHARIMFSMAMWMAVIVAPLQLVVGDMHGLNTLEHQPAKVAAMEGHWETKRGQPLILFGVPDQEAEETKYAIEIPKLGSIILGHDPDAEIQGLKDWPKDERPPVFIVFWSFRVMVGLGVLMILAGAVSLVLRFRKQLFDHTWFLRIVLIMGPAGFVAVIAGWFVTEIGRQPYVVYGLMRTNEAVSPIDTPAVAMSLAFFAVVYFAVFGAGTYYLLRMMAQAPDGTGPEKGTPIRAAGVTPLPALGHTDKGEA